MRMRRPQRPQTRTPVKRARPSRGAPGKPRRVLAHLVAVLQVRLPGDVSLVHPLDESRPFLRRLRLANSPDLAIDQDLLLGATAPGIGTSIDRAPRHLLQPADAQRLPGELARAVGEGAPRRYPKARSPRPAHDRVGGRLDRKTLEDRADGAAHGEVGIQLEAPLAPDIPRGRQEAQLAARRLPLLCTVEPQPEPVELGFGHRSLEVEQQLVVAVLRVVDRLLVGDDDSGYGAQGQEALPVLRRPGEARNLDGEDRPRHAVRDRFCESGKSAAALRRRPAAPEVLVDDFDNIVGPAQRAGALSQCVLPGRGLGVFEHLRHRRLPDVDEGSTLEVPCTDLARHGSIRFLRSRPPRRRPGGRAWPTTARAPAHRNARARRRCAPQRVRSRPGASFARG